MAKEPYITNGGNFKPDAEYGTWLQFLKSSYRKSQIKAAVKVNAEKLRWNWNVGRDLVLRKAEEHWGSGVVERLSLDLRNEFPDEKGFGADNLWLMKRWYLFYSQKLDQVGQVLQILYNQADTKLEQVVQVSKTDMDEAKEGISFPELFALIPWGHHIEIIKRCKTGQEALFYIREIIKNGWSRTILTHYIQANLYAKQGKAISTFSDFLPEAQAKLAQDMSRDNYDFGFVTVPEGYDEHNLEDELCKQMTRFLLELGSGFAFVGRQKELVVGDMSRRIDLLFYFIPLSCYIVLELKVVPFQPEFAGKINFYISAVDELLKSDKDNPTIGLLICSDMNETEVRYAFRGVSTPIGVATYSNVQIKQIQNMLPSIEDLKAQVKLIQQEIKRREKEEE